MRQIDEHKGATPLYTLIGLPSGELRPLRAPCASSATINSYRRIYLLLQHLAHLSVRHRLLQPRQLHLVHLGVRQYLLHHLLLRLRI